MFKLTYITAILALFLAAALAAPYQELPPKAGHVPVYIREGDTPLTEIHPKLAEAFHEEENVAKNQLKNQTPVVAPHVEEEANGDKAKEQEAKDKIGTNDDQLHVDEVTASDIAEFDDAKYRDDDKQPHEIENPVKNNA